MSTADISQGGSSTVPTLAEVRARVAAGLPPARWLLVGRSLVVRVLYEMSGGIVGALGVAGQFEERADRVIGEWLGWCATPAEVEALVRAAGATSEAAKAA